MNVTKSIAMYPMMPLDLQASATCLQASLRTSGSTEDWGMDTPQQEKGVSAWIWSPIHRTLARPVGSITMSTVKEVMLSDGGVASMIPPVIEYHNVRDK